MPFLKVATSVCFVVALFCIISCNVPDVTENKVTIVVSAFGESLSLDSLSARIPDAMTFDDSTLMANRIIEGWVREQVLLVEAEKNLSYFDNSFDDAITAYRNALLVSSFESRFVASRLNREVSEDAIEDFHSKHSELFLLQEHVLRALFVNLSDEETDLDSTRIWLTQADSISIPKLEQWSIEHNAQFALDYEYWWFLSDLLDQIPMQIYRLEDQLRERRLIEFTDNNTRYLLRILDHQFKDRPSPLGIARDRIEDLIIQERRRNLLEGLRDDLVKDAWAQGEIVIDSIPS